MTSQTVPDYAAIKTRQQTTWATGNYGNIGARVQIVAEQLCDAVDLRAGERVLDVATGHGNTAIAAARAFCPTVGIDYVPALLEQARRRAAAEGLEVTFLDGDAEALPVEDGSFDVVLSTFGVMFAPDQHQAAAELLRVCRPGGRIGLASWTPDGAGGALFRTVGSYVPPAAGVSSPALWGTAEHLRELFGPHTEIHATRRTVRMRFPSMDFWLDYFATHFGPTRRAYETLGPSGGAALRADLAEAVGPFNVSGDDTLVLAQDYLQAVIHAPS